MSGQPPRRFSMLYVQTDDDDWLAYTSGRLAQRYQVAATRTDPQCLLGRLAQMQRQAVPRSRQRSEEAAGVGHAVGQARTREVEAPETYTIASVSRHGTSEDSMHLPLQPGGTRPMGRSLRRRLAEAKCPVTWAGMDLPCGQPKLDTAMMVFLHPPQASAAAAGADGAAAATTDTTSFSRRECTRNNCR